MSRMVRARKSCYFCYRAEADLGIGMQSEGHRGVPMQGGVNVVQDLLGRAEENEQQSIT